MRRFVEEVGAQTLPDASMAIAMGLPLFDAAAEVKLMLIAKSLEVKVPVQVEFRDRRKVAVWRPQRLAT